MLRCISDNNVNSRSTRTFMSQISCGGAFERGAPAAMPAGYASVLARSNGEPFPGPHFELPFAGQIPVDMLQFALD